MLRILFAVFFAVFFMASASASASAAAATSPYFVRFELAGEGVAADAAFTLRVNPHWAPLGAARFGELVAAKFYDDQRFFRVLDGMYDIWIAQFGIHGEPGVHAGWEQKRISDDPTKTSNVRGTVSFATSGRNSRTTQLFLNFGDCSKVLDADFAPFAEVVAGMAAVDSIFKVGEGPPDGSGPAQGDIVARGNAYLDADFPTLTRIVTARVVDAPAQEGL